MDERRRKEEREESSGFHEPFMNLVIPPPLLPF